MTQDRVGAGVPRILVIEDDGDVLALLGSHLRRLGFDVLSAQSGEIGVAIASAERPDAVVVDLILPGIDGREVIRTIRADERLRGCRLIATSTLGEDDCRVLAVDAVLPKPFTRRDVAHALTVLDQQVR